MPVFESLLKSTQSLGRNCLKNYSRSLTISSAKTAPRKFNLSKIYGEYNSRKAFDVNRYVIKDKSPYAQSHRTNVTKYLQENPYFLRKTVEEKRRCFDNIRFVQQQLPSRFKPSGDVFPQTVYDPDKPNLWMRVRDMYCSRDNLITNIIRKQNISYQ